MALQLENTLRRLKFCSIQLMHVIFVVKKKIKRISVGIWSCKGCNRFITGGAWTLCTQAAITARGTIRRLRELS